MNRVLPRYRIYLVILKQTASIRIASIRLYNIWNQAKSISFEKKFIACWNKNIFECFIHACHWLKFIVINNSKYWCGDARESYVAAAQNDLMFTSILDSQATSIRRVSWEMKLIQRWIFVAFDCSISSTCLPRLAIFKLMLGAAD